jgi:hypothetical protein
VLRVERKRSPRRYEGHEEKKKTKTIQPQITQINADFFMPTEPTSGWRRAPFLPSLGKPGIEKRADLLAGHSL